MKIQFIFLQVLIQNLNSQVTETMSDVPTEIVEPTEIGVSTPWSIGELSTTEVEITTTVVQTRPSQVLATKKSRVAFTLEKDNTPTEQSNVKDSEEVVVDLFKWLLGSIFILSMTSLCGFLIYVKLGNPYNKAREFDDDCKYKESLEEEQFRQIPLESHMNWDDEILIVGGTFDKYDNDLKLTVDEVPTNSESENCKFAADEKEFILPTEVTLPDIDSNENDA